jgi:DNA modification methylase
MFGYETHQTDSALEYLLKRYERTECAIPVDFRTLVPCLACPERATHLLHSYPAKLLVHIPFFFLDNTILSSKGDLVADPFCGSGTVLLESQLAGRVSIGADSNPLARLLTTVKTSPISASVLDAACDRLFTCIPEKPRNDAPDVVNLEHWFYPHVIHQLQCLHEAIETTRRRDVRDFFRVCFSNCVKRVSLADPRLSVPVRLRSGQYPEGHHLRDKTDAHLRHLERVNVFQVFKDVLTANRKRMASLEPIMMRLPPARVVSCDARHLCSNGSFAEINGRRQDDSCVQLVITSPPYPGAQKYIRSCSLSLGWLGLCRSDELLEDKRETIGREEFRQADYATFIPTGLPQADRILVNIHAINPVRAAIASTYLREMRQAIQEIWRVVKIGGYFVLVAANNQICGREFQTEQYLRLIAEQAGFRLILRLIDDIRSRGLMTKRNKTASVITREWVLVFLKERRSDADSG